MHHPGWSEDYCPLNLISHTNKSHYRRSIIVVNLKQQTVYILLYTLYFSNVPNTVNFPKLSITTVTTLLLIKMYLLPVDNVFGCHLDALCAQERTTVPCFVEKCIRAVEKRGNPSQKCFKIFFLCNTKANLWVWMCWLTGLDIDGLYRVSGNLAVIQKLRYKADHGKVCKL